MEEKLLYILISIWCQSGVYLVSMEGKVLLTIWLHMLTNIFMGVIFHSYLQIYRMWSNLSVEDGTECQHINIDF